MMDADYAETMADLFSAAAKASPLRQVRVEMNARAREWKRAARDLEEYGDDAVIELAGSVGRYMKVVGRDRGSPWLTVIKHTANGSLMLEDEDFPGPPMYRSYHDAASPMVVKR